VELPQMGDGLRSILCVMETARTTILTDIKPRNATALLVLIVIAAATLRFGHLGYDSLGHDEAARANRSDHGPIEDGQWMPPLKFVMLRSIQHFVSRDEFVMRLPYAVAGVACVLLVFGLTRQVVGCGAAVVVASLVAFNPVMVQYSRVMKVFSLESLATVSLFWLGVRACRQRTRRAIVWFTVAAVVGIGITYTGSLVAAAWVPILGSYYLRRDEQGRREPVAFLLTSVVLLAAALSCYAWLSSAPIVADVKKYYDTQEVAWPTAYTAPVLMRWLYESVKGAGLYVLGVTQDWPPLSWCAATLQAMAIGLSVGLLWKRSKALCVAAGILGLEVILAGAFRLYPMGRLRTMTFLIPLAAVFVGCGFWEFLRRFRWSPASVGLVGLCIVLPGMRAVRASLIEPLVSEHIRPVIDHIRSSLQPGDALFVYYGASDAFEFYGDFDVMLRQMDNLGPPRFVEVNWGGMVVPALVEPVSDRQNSEAFGKRFDEWMAKHERVWFLLSHDWKGEHQQWVEQLRGRYAMVDEIVSDNASAYQFVVRSRSASREATGGGDLSSAWGTGGDETAK
jgi:dolichyl-phosphate-mannose-protein mannosyltransferase